MMGHGRHSRRVSRCGRLCSYVVRHRCTPFHDPTMHRGEKDMVHRIATTRSHIHRNYGKKQLAQAIATNWITHQRSALSNMKPPGIANTLPKLIGRGALPSTCTREVCGASQAGRV